MLLLQKHDPRLWDFMRNTKAQQHIKTISHEMIDCKLIVSPHKVKRTTQNQSFQSKEQTQFSSLQQLGFQVSILQFSLHLISPKYDPYMCLEICFRVNIKRLRGGFILGVA